MIRSSATFLLTVGLSILATCRGDATDYLGEQLSIWDGYYANDLNHSSSAAIGGGNYVSADAHDSLAVGRANDCFASQTFVLGVDNVVGEGEGNIVAGWNNSTSLGTFSLLIGMSNSLHDNATTSLIVGQLNDMNDSNGSIIVGYNNAVSNVSNMAMFGTGLIAEGDVVPHTIVGLYNLEATELRPELFTVANGTGTALNQRSNAFTVFQDSVAEFRTIKIDPRPEHYGIWLGDDRVATVGYVLAGNFSVPISQGNYLQFPHIHAQDYNDGKIGAGIFAPGLNLVGVNTDNAYRKLSIWGEISQQQNDGMNTWAGTNYFSSAVGIGTATPEDHLTVDGGNTMVRSGNALRLRPTPNDYDFYLQSRGSAFSSRLAIGSALGVPGLQVESMSILTNGSVGVGTTAPEKRFHVVGDSKFDGVVVIQRQGDIRMGEFGRPEDQ